jgi:hypothetical protein
MHRESQVQQPVQSETANDRDSGNLDGSDVDIALTPLWSDDSIGPTDLVAGLKPSLSIDDLVSGLGFLEPLNTISLNQLGLVFAESPVALEAASMGTAFNSFYRSLLGGRSDFTLDVRAA